MLNHKAVTRHRTPKQRQARAQNFPLTPPSLPIIVSIPYFAGDAAFVGDAGAFAAGDALELVGAALLAGLAAAAEAGRRPRLLGLVSMFAARLLTIFASVRATSTKAAFRISLRWFVKAIVICWRTPWLSRVRFSVCRC